MVNRRDSDQLRMKDHYVTKWNGMTACGRDSLVEDLNQALEWDLVTCNRCLGKIPNTSDNSEKDYEKENGK